MTAWRIACFALFSAVLAGGAAAQPAAEAPAAVAGSERPDAWESLIDRDRALDLEGLAGWGAAFANEGRLIRDGEPVAEGTEAVREVLASWRASYVAIKWEPRVAEVSAAGDLGLTLGVLTRTRPAPGGGFDTWNGTYVRTWRRLEGGGWELLVDIANLQPGLGQ